MKRVIVCFLAGAAMFISSCTTADVQPDQQAAAPDEAAILETIDAFFIAIGDR